MNPHQKGMRRILGEELLHQGIRDVDISNLLGVSREAVRQWRAALGLPAQHKTKLLGPAEVDHIRTHTRQSAATTAAQLGCSRQAVLLWRQKLGVRGTRSNPRRDAALDHLRNGMKPREAAELVGRTQRTILRWRGEAGLTGDRHSYNTSLGEQCAACLARMSARSTSAALSLPPSTVKLWAARWKREIASSGLKNLGICFPHEH